MDAPTLAAAHIITADAVALGDPEIIIMTQDDGSGARLVECHEHVWTTVDPGGALRELDWRPVGDWTEVDTGYWIVNVERIP
jgi:hypothetical protein